MTSELERRCDRTPRVTVDVTFGADEKPGDGFERDWAHNSWTVTLHYRRRQLTVPFFTGVGIEREPTSADVLSCLLSDATSFDYAGGFEDWAADFGYDTDSRRAERTFRACETVSKRLHRFLGDDFAEFAGLEH